MCDLANCKLDRRVWSVDRFEAIWDLTAARKPPSTTNEDVQFIIDGVK